MPTTSLVVRLLPTDGNGFDYALLDEGATVLAEASAEIPFGSVGLTQPLHYALPSRGLDADQLATAGRELFDLLLPGDLRKPFLDVLRALRVGEFLRVHLACDDGRFLSLPWELIYDSSEQFIAQRGNVSIVRCSDVTLAASDEARHGPPLHILMLVSSPDDQIQLDYEREQDALLDALDPVVREGKARVTFLEEGTLDALVRELRAERYDIVHLTGHGGYNEQTAEGYFAFEDAAHQADPVTAKALLERLMEVEHAPQLFFLGGCVTSKTSEGSLAGMAQALAEKDVAQVVGYQYSVFDRLAT